MISIVIPAYNERDNILELFNKIELVMERNKLSYEVIFIDDGSTDDTLSVMKSIKDKKVNVININKNSGKGNALMSGFKMASGDIVITLDADLQDDPEEVPKFINKINEGYDLVVGWKYDRKDSFHKVFRSKIFNFLTNLLTGIRLHDSNCGFKAYRKEVTNNLEINGGFYRYIPSIVNWKGFKIAEVMVNHKKRIYGKSKYGFGKIFTGLADLIRLVLNKKKFDGCKNG